MGVQGRCRWRGRAGGEWRTMVTDYARAASGVAVPFHFVVLRGPSKSRSNAPACKHRPSAALLYALSYRLALPFSPPSSSWPLAVSPPRRIHAGPQPRPSRLHILQRDFGARLLRTRLTRLPFFFNQTVFTSRPLHSRCTRRL